MMRCWDSKTLLEQRNRMKVLHLLNTDRYSGAENVVCQIIEMFRNDANFEMAYCSPDGSIKEILAERNIRFVPLKKMSAPELKRIVKEEKPDLIHAHDFRASIMSSIACRKIPVISHLHNNSPWLQKYGIYSLTYGATCRKYRAILTVSGSVFDEFVFGDKFRSKLTVVGNPINVHEIQSKVIAKSSEKDYDLGFCGRFSLPKNPEGFIEIVDNLYKEIPNIKAAMVGSGEQFDEMKELIKQKGLENVITLYGFRNNPYEIMTTFKILCMPSRWEGFGLAAVEALALGVPVVCSNVGGLPGIVNDGCGRVCKNETEMISFCKTLLYDEDLLRTYSDSAKERAEELNNTSEYKKRLIEIYGYRKEQ